MMELCLYKVASKGARNEPPGVSWTPAITAWKYTYTSSDCWSPGCKVMIQVLVIDAFSVNRILLQVEWRQLLFSSSQVTLSLTRALSGLDRSQTAQLTCSDTACFHLLYHLSHGLWSPLPDILTSLPLPISLNVYK